MAAMKSIAPFLIQDGAEIHRPAPRPRWALAGLSLSMLLSSLGTSIANVGLPSLAQAFGAPFAAVQWVVLAYLLAITSLIVSVGRLGDMFGRRRLLLTGISLFSLASALGGAAPNLGILIGTRALQGVGAAAMMAMTLAVAGESMPKTRTGRVMGLLGTMSAIGTALGPSVGGLLIDVSGWRAVFLLNVPLGLVTLFLIHRHLPNHEESAAESTPGFDAWGTALLACALAAYALAMTFGTGPFRLISAGLLVVAAAAIGLFVLVESKIDAPLIQLSALRDGTLRGGLLASGLVSTVMMTTLVVGPFYLTLAVGLSPAAAGMVLSVGPLVSALAGVPAGRTVDKWGAHRTVAAGLAGIASGGAILSLLPAPRGVAYYLAPLVVITMSYALFQTANNTAVLRATSAGQRGAVSGLLNLSRNLGLVTGASLMGAFFTFASRASDSRSAEPAAIAGGMRATFAVATMLMLVTLIAIVRKRTGTSARAGGDEPVTARGSTPSPRDAARGSCPVGTKA